MCFNLYRLSLHDEVRINLKCMPLMEKLFGEASEYIEKLYFDLFIVNYLLVFKVFLSHYRV